MFKCLKPTWIRNFSYNKFYTNFCCHPKMFLTKKSYLENNSILCVPVAKFIPSK